MRNIVKLPVPKAAQRRVVRNTIAALLGSRPRLTVDENGLCRLRGYYIGDGVVCCHTQDDYDMCTLHDYPRPTP